MTVVSKPSPSHYSKKEIIQIEVPITYGRPTKSKKTTLKKGAKINPPLIPYYKDGDENLHYNSVIAKAKELILSSYKYLEQD